MAQNCRFWAAIWIFATVSLGCTHPSHAQSADVRTVTMRAVVDEAYRGLPNWEATLRRTVAAVSDIYEKNFQIRFTILDVVPKTFGEFVSPRHLVDMMKASVPIGDADVLVGFSHQRCERLERGWALAFSRFAVVMTGCGDAILAAQRTPEQTLAHELAHLFGAFHPSRGVDSLMRPLGAAEKFDDQTSRVIRLMRTYDFRRGVLGLDEAVRRTWSAIYAKGHAADEPNPLASAIRNAGLDLLRSGKIDDGEAALREAVKIDPSFPAPHGDLGLLYSRRGQLDEAVRELRTAKQLDFRQVGAQTELGFVLLRLGKDEDALWEFREALRVDPRFARARVGHGFTLARGKKFAEAISEFREAIKLEPGNGGTHVRLAMAFYGNGQYAEAWEAVAQARALGASIPPAFVNALAERMPPPAAR
ncbi:MAG TPA: tetratricopeptide repeat protein [Methylomirabilota bacterium]|nr:tetratricopeptide repeat protein [Methylomirabilota bacterium]